MKNATPDDNGFLFNIDVLIKSPSNALALQRLFEMLNRTEEVIDFRVKSGMELGEIIDSLIQAKKNSVMTKISKPKLNELSSISKDTPPKNATKGNSIPKKESKPVVVNAPPSAESDPFEWIKIYSKDNRLVRLTANRNGKKISLPCRILNFDDTNQMVSVYHVDEKQVYTFKLNEIDEFSAS